MIIDAFAHNPLFLFQAVESNIKGLWVSQYLGLTQTTVQNFIVQSVESELHLQHLSVAAADLNLAASSVLNLQQDSHPRVLIENVVQQLFLISDMVHEEQFLVPRHTLALTQEAVALVAKGSHSNLNLDQSVSVSFTRNVFAENVVPLQSDSTSYLPDYYWTSYEFEVIQP